MLAKSPEGFAEEYAIYDYQCFDGYSLGKYASIEMAHETACFIEEYPVIGVELLTNISIIHNYINFVTIFHGRKAFFIA